MSDKTPSMPGLEASVTPGTYVPSPAKTEDVSIDDIYRILNAIKPVNFVCIAKDFVRSPSIAAAAVSVVRLLELWGLYWERTSNLLSFIGRFVAHAFSKLYSMCSDFAAFVTSKVGSPGFTQNSSEFKQQANEDTDLKYDPGSVSEAVAKEDKSLLDFLKEWKQLPFVEYILDMPAGIRETVVAISGIAIPLLALAFGFYNVQGKGFADSVAKLGNAIRGITTSIRGFGEFSAWIKSFVGDLLGVESTAPKAVLARDIAKVTEKMQQKMAALDADAGVVLDSKDFLDDICRDVATVDKTYEALAVCPDNVASLAPLVTSMRLVHQNLKRRHDAIVRTVIGKQVPVVIWIYGKSGVGKSKMASYIVERLCEMEGKRLLVYTRPKADKFWSSYQGQQVVIFDDFNSSTDNEDHRELNEIYTPNSFLLNQADIADKGMRFCSRYVIICTNFAYIQKSETVANPHILDRRRDLVVEVEDAELPHGESEHPKDHYKSDYSHLTLTRHALRRVDGVLPYYVNRNRGNDAKNKRESQIRMRFIIDFMFNKCLERSAEFRQSILDRQAPIAAPPPMENIADIVQDMEPVRPALVRPRGRQVAVDAFQNVFVQQAKKTRTRVKTVLFLGPPGTGKTSIAREVEEQYEVIDEFCDSRERFLHAKQLVWDMYEGKAGKPVLLIANENCWDRVLDESNMTDDDIAAFKRRCEIYRFDFRAGRIYGHYTHADAKQRGFDKCVTVSVFVDGAFIRKIPHSGIVASLDAPPTVEEMRARRDCFEEKPDDVDWVVEAICDVKHTDPIGQKAITFVTKQVQFVKGSKLERAAVFRELARYCMSFTEFDDMSLDASIRMLAANDLKYEGPAGVIRTSDNTAYYIWSEDGIMTFAREFEVTPKFERTVAASVEIATMVYLSKSSTIAHLDVLALMMRLGVAFVASYVGIPFEERKCRICGFDANYCNGCYYEGAWGTCEKCGFILSNEGWGSDCEDLDMDDPEVPPLPKVSKHHKPIALSMLQKQKRAVYDGSSFGAHAKNARDFYHCEGRMHSVYSQDDKLRVKKLKAEAKHDASGQGLISSLVAKKKIVAEAKHDASGQGLVSKLVKDKAVLVAESEMKHEAATDPGARDLIHVIGRNCVAMLNVEGKILCWGVMLRERLGVTVAHIQKYVARIRVKDVEYPVKIVSADTYRDTLYFDVDDSTCPAFKDITRHLRTRKEGVEWAGSHAYVVFSRIGFDGVDTQIVTLDALAKKEIDKSDRWGQIYQGHVSNAGLSPIQTMVGDCGSPVIIINPRCPTKFLGIHAAASIGQGFAALLYAEDLPFRAEASVDELTILRHQDVLLFDEAIDIPESTVKVVGVAHDGVDVCKQFYPAKTKYHRSPFTGLTVGDTIHEPAILSSKDPRCDVDDLLFDSVFKWNVPVPDVDVKLLDHVVESVADYLAWVCKKSGYRVPVLTKTEAINRVTEIPGSNPIYRYSAPGYPWNHMRGVTRKSVLFREDNGLFKIDMNKKCGVALNAAIDQLIDSGRRGERTAVIFQAVLKDEPLKMKKIYECKTRSITASPVDYTIAHRMYFHSASALLTTLFAEIPIKIGINPLSMDWHKLYVYHARAGMIGFDCDFKNWDATVPRVFMEQLPRIYNRIYATCDPNWTAEDDVIRTSLHSVLHGPLVLYHEYILRMAGGQMSGQPQTALDNSLINFIYAYYVWVKLARVHAPELANFTDFQQRVACSFYGDDNMFTFDPSIRSWFHFDSYAAECAKLGLTVTPANKTDDWKPYKRLEEMTFLKRSFVRMEDSPYFFGCLEKNSIQRMLDWTTGPSHYFRREDDEWYIDRTIVSQIVDGILVESAFHGRHFFENIRAHLRDRVRDCNLPLQTPVYTFEKLMCDILKDTA